MTTTCCPILTIPKHTRSVLPIHYCTHLTPEMCSSTNVDVLQGNLLIKVDRVQNAGAPLLQGTSAKWSAALSCQRWLWYSSACIPEFQNFRISKIQYFRIPKNYKFQNFRNKKKENAYCFIVKKVNNIVFMFSTF